MGSRDLRDLHVAGDLDMDADVDPMPLPEMSLEAAEDLYLAVCCSTPKYADHSRVQDVHLSPRGKIILNGIKAIHQQGWSQVTLEHLDGPVFPEIRDRYYASLPPRQRPKVIPALDFGEIPKRLRTFDPATSIGFCEDVMLSAFEKAKYIAIHEKAAKLCQQEGPAVARAFVAEREARLASLTAGVRWVHAGQAAGEVTAGRRARGTTPDGDPSARLISTNFPGVDRACCNYDSESATAIAGWNGHGKSTLAFQLLGHMALMGVPCRYISAEDKMKLTMKRQLIWLLADLRIARRVSTNQPSGRDAPDGYVLADVVELENIARRVVDKMPLFLCHLPGCTIAQAEAAVVESARSGAKVACFDYLSAIEEPPSIDTTKWRNYCAARLIGVAKSNGLHLILCAQLKRPTTSGKSNDRDETKPPTRFDIENAPAVEQKCENVLLPHRPQKNNWKTGLNGKREPLDVENASIVVAKAKDGGTGTIALGWCNARHCYDRGPKDTNQGNLLDKGVQYPPPTGGPTDAF